VNSSSTSGNISPFLQNPFKASLPQAFQLMYVYQIPAVTMNQYRLLPYTGHLHSSEVKLEVNSAFDHLSMAPPGLGVVPVAPVVPVLSSIFGTMLLSLVTTPSTPWSHKTRVGLTTAMYQIFTLNHCVLLVVPLLNCSILLEVNR